MTKQCEEERRRRRRWRKRKEAQVLFFFFLFLFVPYIRDNNTAYNTLCYAQIGDGGAVLLLFAGLHTKHLVGNALPQCLVDDEELSEGMVNVLVLPKSLGKGTKDRREEEREREREICL